MTVISQTKSIAAQPTDWSSSLTLNQVDPTGLTSVGLSLTATLASGAIVENLEASAAGFLDRTAATADLDRPDGSVILTATPSTTLQAALGAFDGTIDGAGASGRTLSTMQQQTVATPSTGTFSAIDAALLEGFGTAQLPVTATARVAATGPGNMLAVFASTVAASATLQATYDGTAGTPAGGGLIAVSGPFTPFYFPPFGSIETAAEQAVVVSAATGTAGSVAVRGFDPLLGQLVGVAITVDATDSGTVAVENLDPVASSATITQNASLNLARADGTALLAAAANPLSATDHLAAFDGTLDFAGTSGASTPSSVSGAPAGRSGLTTDDAATLAAFTGATQVSLQVSRTGQTQIDGPGNLAIGTSLVVGGTVSVRYVYIPADPNVAATATLFDSAYYLAHNPDVAAAGVDPLQHYLQSGWHEGRNPSAAFDTNDYLAANPDVAAANYDPLEHYANNGRYEGRAEFAVPAVADPLVDAKYYYAAYADVRAAGVDAAAHFLTYGWTEHRNPDALFDTNYVLAHNPAAAAAHIDPLLTFENGGWQAGQDPSAAFSTTRYLAANPDVKAAGVNPLLHHLQHGQFEGRAIFAV